jgi:hypothetical protein
MAPARGETPVPRPVIRWLVGGSIGVVTPLILTYSTSAEASRSQEPAIVAEARTFMDGYAADLRSGARDALGNRYDPRGLYLSGEGRKALLPPEGVRAMYRGAGWQPPKGFEWVDLSYEPLGTDAVLVMGRFNWEQQAGAPIRASYTGLLVRSNGQLRIRHEHESFAPQAAAQRPSPGS